MRKRNLMLVSLSLVLTLVFSSCGKNSDDVSKIHIYQSEDVKGLVMLTGSQVEQKVALSSSSRLFDFGLVEVRMGCSACRIYHNLLEDYQKTDPIILYGISSNDYMQLNVKDSDTYPYTSGTPTAIYYSLGKVVKKVEGIYDEKAVFASDIRNARIPNGIIYLNDYTTDNVSDTELNYSYAVSYPDNKGTKTLDNKISLTPSLNVLYTWNSCFDCRSLWDSYLLKWAEENPENRIYVYEVDGIRDEVDGSNKEAQEAWNQFKKDHGLTLYKTGYVPSLVHYENGAATDITVYHNEGEIVSDSEGNYYYTEAQVEGVTSLRAKTRDELKKKAEEVEFSALTRMLTE